MMVARARAQVPLVDVHHGDRRERIDLAGARRHRRGEDHRDHQPDDARRQVLGDEREKDVVGVVEALLAARLLDQLATRGARVLSSSFCAARYSATLPLFRPGSAGAVRLRQRQRRLLAVLEGALVLGFDRLELAAVPWMRVELARAGTAPAAARTGRTRTPSRR